MFRKKQIFIIGKKYSLKNLLKTKYGFYFVGYENVDVDYNPSLLHPQLLGQYVAEVKPDITGLTDEDILKAFESGYLKHDSRGYYFSKNKEGKVNVTEM